MQTLHRMDFDLNQRWHRAQDHLAFIEVLWPRNWRLTAKRYWPTTATTSDCRGPTISSEIHKRSCWSHEPHWQQASCYPYRFVLIQLCGRAFVAAKHTTFSLSMEFAVADQRSSPLATKNWEKGKEKWEMIKDTRFYDGKNLRWIRERLHVWMKWEEMIGFFLFNKAKIESVRRERTERRTKRERERVISARDIETVARHMGCA